MTMADIVCDQFSAHLYCQESEFCCEDNTRCCSLYFRDDWANFYKFFTFLFVCLVIYVVAQPRQTSKYENCKDKPAGNLKQAESKADRVLKYMMVYLQSAFQDNYNPVSKMSSPELQMKAETETWGI